MKPSFFAAILVVIVLYPLALLCSVIFVALGELLGTIVCLLIGYAVGSMIASATTVYAERQRRH